MCSCVYRLWLILGYFNIKEVRQHYLNGTTDQSGLKRFIINGRENNVFPRLKSGNVTGGKQRQHNFIPKWYSIKIQLQIRQIDKKKTKQTKR